MKESIQIAGMSRTRTQEEWELGLVDLAVEAGISALNDAKGASPTAVICANALGAALGDQRNLALYVSSALGLSQVETLTVSCCEASGGAAIRQAVSMLEALRHQCILVIGAEKTSDALPDKLESVRATGLNAAQEASFGFGPAISSALGMSRYLEEYNLAREMFYYLAHLAHKNGAKNKLGIFSWELSLDQYLKSPIVATPMSVCDNAPLCDGAAAVVLKRTKNNEIGPYILASSSVSEKASISVPIMSLTLESASKSTQEALSEAGLKLCDISLFELHDSSSFLAALSIEAAGLAKKGEATLFAKEHSESKSEILWSFGGNKSRGNVPGASGVFQLVEASLRLREGEYCYPDAQYALVQCLGSLGSMAVTHIIGKTNANS